MKMTTLSTCILIALSTMAQARTAPVIVELFTSQGCSSCPPADAYVKDLAARKDVLPLSFNVDYWDYLGWKDTLGKAAYSQRQRDYAMRLGLRGVYTPQIVVDGQLEGVGNQRSAIDKLIENCMASAETLTIKIARTRTRTTLTVPAAAAIPATPATLWLLRYAPTTTIKIQRGENRGRNITYTNTVREITPLGHWQGQPLIVHVASSDMNGHKGDAYVVLLQEDNTGPILSAARLTIAPNQPAPSE